ncbi:hypothetical protein QJS04_geneDACA024234 [Acorus gramineus]|uniref:DUF7069 domain-containing protein n=1 Tax=Acorus gramineus TaxID=55184 RepID=A0AAV9A114_ACOGR|nr:hypothetical protein QJS04_geneDACA024234 [Acorus gramineus]
MWKIGPLETSHRYCVALKGSHHMLRLFQRRLPGSKDLLRGSVRSSTPASLLEPEHIYDGRRKSTTQDLPVTRRQILRFVHRDLECLHRCRRLPRDRLCARCPRRVLRARSRRAHYAIRRVNVSTLRFLLTGRPYEHISRKVVQERNGFEASSIHIQGDEGPVTEEIVHEIRLVIQARVEEAAKFWCMSTQEQELLQENILKVPNRTYLWVTLVFDGLMKRKRAMKKQDILDLTSTTKLPQTVYYIYESLLAKSEDQEDTRKLLGFVLAAERPLALMDIAVFLAYNDGQQTWSALLDNMITQERIQGEIRDLCGLFVSVVDDRGADVNAQGAEYGSALHAAAHHNNEDLIRQLLGQTADLTAKDRHGWTSAMIASVYGHSKIAELLSSTQSAASMATEQTPSDLVRMTGNSGLNERIDGLVITAGCFYYLHLCATPMLIKMILEHASKEELDRKLQYRANHPMPFSSDTFYFEVTIIQSSSSRQVPDLLSKLAICS